MTTNPMSPDLIAWGATYTPATVTPGQEYWKLVSADGPMDIGGNINVFVDVWDKDGNRMVGVPVVFFRYYKDGKLFNDRKLTEPKTGEPYAVDWPIYSGGNAYGVHVDENITGIPSDNIFGFGMGSFVPHHSFRAVFQLSVSEQPPIIVPPDPPMTAREAIGYARFYLDMAEKLLLALTLLLLLSASGCVWKPTTLEAKPFEYDHDWMQMRPL